MRETFPVTTKAVIFNNDRSKVILLRLPNSTSYSLPGGHMERGESIDECMARELYEECGVQVNDLRKVTFFQHKSGKLVLAFSGTMDETTLVSQQSELEGTPIWVSRFEFESIDIKTEYRKLVMAHFDCGNVY